MGRILLLAGVALALAGCGADEPTRSPHEGLFGTVRISPASPVCRAGSSCSRPARGFRLVFVGSGGQVTATTDRKGRYRIRLHDGLYAVQPARPPKRGLRPSKVTVPPARFARRDFTYDPGIR